MSYEFKWPVYGHKNQLKFLQETIIQNKLANTYLFYGPGGLGKKTVADYFVKSIFCLSDHTRPCEKCDHCRLVNRGTFLDLYKVGDREDLSVDNIRIFLHQIALSKVSGQRKVAIIYGAETINLFSANALLKTLEEPPAKTTIILIADSIVNLPATVISRCQLVKFRSLTKTDMVDWLANYDFSEAEKDTIINLSFGKPGLALKMMDSNLESFKKNCHFIMKLLDSNTFTAFQAIDRWFEVLKKEYPGYKVYELGNLTKDFLDLLEVFLRDLLWIKLRRPVVNEIYRDELNALAQRLKAANLIKNLLFLNKAKQKLKYNVSPQLLWENLILSVK